MTWILIIVASLIGVVVVMAAIGLVLPRDHVAARRAVLGRPVDDVWRALVDIDAYPRWRRGVTGIERLSPTEFRERSSQGAIRFEIVEDQPREVRITRIADPKLPFGGCWIFELTATGVTGGVTGGAPSGGPSGGSTVLTITEDGFVTNPIFRFLSRTVFLTTSTLEKFLVDLGAHLRVPVEVQSAPPSVRARPAA